MSQEERLSLGRTFLPDNYTLDFVGDPPRTGGAAEYWLVDKLTATRDILLTAKVTRQAEHKPSGVVRVRYVTHGRCEGIVAGEAINLRPGDLSFEAFDADFAIELEEFSCLVLRLPSLSVGYDPAHHVSFRFFSERSAEGAILAASLRTFFDRIEDASLREARTMANIVIGLLAGQMENFVRSEEEAAQGSTRIGAMRRFIDENLDKPGLGLDLIADKFPASRSVIYRAFEADGGLMKYITSRRMARAATLLTLGDSTASVAEIAIAVGYSNQSVFARSFRRHFGMSPSMLRSSFKADAGGEGEMSGDARATGERLRRVLDRDASD